MIITNPAEEFQDEFVQIVRNSEMTSYAIGQLWSAGTEGDPMALRSKIDRWTVRQTKSIRDLVLLLDILGYRLTLQKK